MFETSLLPGRKGVDATRARWVALGSVMVQGLLVAGFVVGPLLWPDTLPRDARPPRMTKLDLQRRPVVKVERPKVVRLSNANAMAAPSSASAPAMVESRRGGMVSVAAPAVSDEVPMLALGGGMGSNGDPLGAGMKVLGVAGGPRVTAAAGGGGTGPVRISEGVSKGMLLAPMRPEYPRMAVLARVEGTVEVTATIDRNGRIVGLRVLSGPAMLRDAAARAVQEARYKPYLLNGQPTEVVTTVLVTFRMNA